GRRGRPAAGGVAGAGVRGRRRGRAVARSGGGGARGGGARSTPSPPRGGAAAIRATGPSWAPAVRVATPAMNSAYGPPAPRSAAVDTAVSPNFVLMIPGSITDTRTPNGLTSKRSASLIASTECLLAWYAPAPRNVSPPALRP